MLRNHSALKAFSSSQLGLGGTVSVAAGPMGRAAAAKALASVGGGGVVWSYCATRGAYAGVSVEGTVLSPRDAINQVGCRPGVCCVPHGGLVRNHRHQPQHPAACPPLLQAFYGRKVSARQLLIAGAVAPPPAAAALYRALDALLAHAGGSAAGAQFLSHTSRVASEPELHHQHDLVPAVSAPPLPDSDSEEWEPEEDAPSAPSAPVRQPWAAQARVAPASHPAWAASAPAFHDEDTPPAWGSLFD